MPVGDDDITADDEQIGLDGGEARLHLRKGRARVQHDGGGPGRLHAEIGDDPVDTERGGDGDAATEPDASRSQTGGGALDAVDEGAIGQRTAPVAVDEGNGIRVGAPHCVGERDHGSDATRPHAVVTRLGRGRAGRATLLQEATPATTSNVSPGRLMALSQVCSPTIPSTIRSRSDW